MYLIHDSGEIRKNLIYGNRGTYSNFFRKYKLGMYLIFCHEIRSNDACFRVASDFLKNLGMNLNEISIVRIVQRTSHTTID